MFKRKKRVNPEVEKAIEKRDELMDEAAEAMQEVDRLQSAIIEEYRQTEEDSSWR